MYYKAQATTQTAKGRKIVFEAEISERLSLTHTDKVKRVYYIEANSMAELKNTQTGSTQWYPLPTTTSADQAKAFSKKTFTAIAGAMLEEHKQALDAFMDRLEQSNTKVMV